jgi:hypothetical protein
MQKEHNGVEIEDLMELTPMATVIVIGWVIIITNSNVHTPTPETGHRATEMKMVMQWA